MIQQDWHNRTSNEVDRQLAANADFEIDRFARERQYVHWYATLLTELAVTVGDDEVVFAYTDYQSGREDLRVAVFTKQLVIVADLGTEDDAVPVIRVVGRRSLTTFNLNASERIDSKNGRSQSWPGSLVLQLTYLGLDKQIEVMGIGYNLYESDKPGAIVELVNGLRGDLSPA